MNTEKLEHNQRNILIIEDNKDIKDSLKLALELEGYNVFSAENGKEGLDRLHSMPTPCMILLDLMMPVMNGWEFMEEMNKDILYAHIPVVIVSALTEKQNAPKSEGYIQKPIDLNNLISIVEKHCH